MSRRAIGVLWRQVARDERHGSLPGLLLLLTVVTGTVDAVSILGLDRVFVANMTGNVVFIAFGLAGAKGFSVSASLIALFVFVVAASASPVVLPSRDGRRLGLLQRATLVELLAVGAATLASAAAGDHPSAGVRDVLVGVLAAAMGVQNTTGRRLAVPDLTTSVLTMTLTGLASDAPHGGWREPAFRIRIAAVTAMFGGAAVGAVLLRQASSWSPLAVGTGLLALVVLLSSRATEPAPRAG